MKRTITVTWAGIFTPCRTISSSTALDVPGAGEYNLKVSFRTYKVTYSSMDIVEVRFGIGGNTVK